jgi:penicillin G amidase
MQNPARSMVLLALMVGTTLLTFLPRSGRRTPRAASARGAGQARASLEAAARTALSDTEGTTELPRLKQQVTVIRDSWGVPHIYAQNQHDMFFTQGFVTAQDRLFQMELWKRAGRGTLAEVLGPQYLDRDIGARLLRYRGDMDVEYASYSPESKQILEALTEGINAYIKTRMAPGGPGFPLEFKEAGFSPEPWKPEDCLTRMAGFPLTRNAVTELAHAELVTMIGAKKASELYDLDPPVEFDPAPGTDYAGLSPALLRNLVGSDVGITFPPQSSTADSYPAEWDSENWGSNNWVVAGKLTETGRPVLANDPHRTVDVVPSLRYLVHLVSPGWNVIGSTEAGSPGVQGGHNERVGFGWTIFGMDQQDLYIEKLDASDPLRYKTEAGWERMRVEKETFHIKGQSDREVALKFTRHGPVVWEDQATHRALALRSVLAEPGAAGYLGCLTMDRVRNWTEFEEAVKRWKVPTHNIVYADIDGNIGEHSVGIEPVRKNWTGLIPEPGDGGYEWDRWVPTSELPHQFNPGRGFIVTANQKMIPQNYPYKVGYEWSAPDRWGRITELLAEAVDSKHKLTMDDMKRIQTDVTPLPAKELVGLLAKVVGNGRDAATEMLLHWDLATTRESAAAALYELWLMNLQNAVTRRAVAGPKAEAILRVVKTLNVTLVIGHLEHPVKEIFGDQPEAARDHLMRETLQAAYAKLGQMESSDPSKWAWGRLHTVVFHHPLESIPEMKSLVDLGPIPRPGDASTVNATSFRPDDNHFYQTGGPTWRQILDVGDWDNSVMVNSPGESGQPASPHYADLLPLWDQGQYIPMLYSRGAVEKHAAARMILEPAR